MSPIELTRSWFRRVWNQREEAAIDELLGPHAFIHGLNLSAPGPEGFLPFYRAFLLGFDNVNIEITEIIEDGNTAMGHAVFTGIHHATQTPVTIEFSLSVRWENGQIVEAKNVVDYLPMLSQLKLFGQDILGQALKPE